MVANLHPVPPAIAGATHFAALRSRSSAVLNVQNRTPPAASSLGPRDARHLARPPRRRVSVRFNSLESHEFSNQFLPTSPTWGSTPALATSGMSPPGVPGTPAGAAPAC